MCNFKMVFHLRAFSIKDQCNIGLNNSINTATGYALVVFVVNKGAIGTETDPQVGGAEENHKRTTKY
jgi:hypothetical protein